MSKLDDIQNCLTEVRDDVKKITQVLAGDEFGNAGLVEDHKNLKTSFYKWRDEIKKIRVVGGVLAAIVSFFVALISIFK